VLHQPGGKNRRRWLAVSSFSFNKKVVIWSENGVFLAQNGLKRGQKRPTIDF
jgi:hypothetical protein